MTAAVRPTDFSVLIAFLTTTWLLASGSLATSCPHKCLCSGRMPLSCAYQDLEGISLTEYSGAVLDGADFTGANLHHAHMASLSLKNAIFNDANLGDATLYMADLQGASFRRANLTGSILSGANMKEVDFTGAEMIHIEASGKKTRFDDAILDGVNARYGVFSGMIGPRVSLDSADMSFTNLVHAKITYAYLFDTVFRGSNLRDADLSEAVMDNTNFYGARTNGVKWGLPSSSENTVFDDALSDDVDIGAKVKGIVPRFGILDQPSNDLPEMEIDATWAGSRTEEEGDCEAATGSDSSENFCADTSDPSSTASSIFSGILMLIAIAAVVIAYISARALGDERGGKNTREQISAQEILSLRTGAPASLATKDQTSETAVLNRAEPVDFHSSENDTDLLNGVGGGVKKNDECEAGSQMDIDIEESIEEEAMVEETHTASQGYSTFSTEERDEQWIYDFPDTSPSTARAATQSRTSDFFVPPPKSPWKGSQSEHDSISRSIRHLGHSEKNESSDNALVVDNDDDEIDFISTVRKDLQLASLRFKERARAAERCVNSMTNLQVLPSVKKPARESHNVPTPRIADCAKSLNDRF